jgi:tungstate transport system substrate-binding protein
MKGRNLLPILLFLSLVLLLPALHSSLRGPGLRVATTTSLYDTGLLEELARVYREGGGGRVAFFPVGTGQAFLQARRGEADLLLVHAPAQEVEFVREGWGENRSVVACNFFVLVGPPGDPAGVENLPPLLALRRIAEAGGEGRARWVSRGDLSGTHLKENELWKEAGYDPENLRREGWYLETGAGMGQTLLVASEKGAYTLSDLGTLLTYLGKGLVNLRVLVRGGRELLNVYSAIPVNPERVRGVDGKGAGRFLEFLLSEEGQRVVGEFGVERYGEPLFLPAAEILRENSDPQLASWIREVALLEG